MGFNWKYLLRLLKKGYWLTMIFTILVFIFWGIVIYFSISFSSTQVTNRIENCKTFTPFIYHLKVCFTTRNCSTWLTICFSRDLHSVTTAFCYHGSFDSRYSFAKCTRDNHLCVVSYWHMMQKRTYNFFKNNSFFQQ